LSSPRAWNNLDGFMALPSTRYEFRIALSHVERGVQLETTLVAARHPSETAEHLWLRVLAFCLLHREGLVMGAGLCDGDASDLEERDAAARVRTWVECGAVDAARLRRVVQGNAGAEVHVVFGDERRYRELLAGVAKLPHGIKDAGRVTLWRVDEGLVAALAAREDRRQRLAVTVVEGHVYVDVDGGSPGARDSFDGEVVAAPLASVIAA
jgi:uncharacterized protein YaeQ